MIIIMFTIMIDEEARTFQGVRQKLLSGFFLLRGYPPPPHLLPPSGKSFCQKNLSGNGGDLH